MSFEKDIEEFEKSHPCKETIVDGITFSYMLCGNENSDKTLVYLVGGTGLPVIWFNHVKAMEKDHRILTMNYPMQIKDLEELADMIAKLVDSLGLRNPVYIGASLGGFIAQLIARKHPDKVHGMCLYSTCSLSENSIADMKKQYKIYGLLLFMMKIIPYNLLRKMMISICLKQVGIEDEAPEDKKYMEDLFRWVYSRYTKEFDIHMTSLIATVVDLEPFTKEKYDRLCHNTLLVLPTDDKAFSDEAKKDLKDMMPYAKTENIKGGHTATLYKVDGYVNVTRKFLESL